MTQCADIAAFGTLATLFLFMSNFFTQIFIQHTLPLGDQSFKKDKGTRRLQ